MAGDKSMYRIPDLLSCKGALLMVIKNYKDNAELRKSFNELAERTFGINFEDWYQNGFWSDKYNPCSIVLDGKVIANVSVNHMNFIRHGKREFYIQLGTVMTDEKYRNHGYIRQIMDEIEKDYGQKADGIFLFANDSVTDFYPKFGFRKADEYQYTAQISAEEPSIEQIPMRDKAQWTLLENAIRRSIPQSAFEMVENNGLLLFYVTKYMQENVFYHREQDAFVIAETENADLFIHNVFASHPVDLMQIANAFGGGIRRVSLGFTPKDQNGFAMSPRKEEDCTLFIKGKGFDSFETERLMFPTLSHA